MSEILSQLGDTSRVIVGQLAWASLAGGLLTCLLWLACKAMPRLLSPGVKATLWWLACLKLVLDLVWLAPLPLRVLPAPAVTDFHQQSVSQQVLETPAPFSTDSGLLTVEQTQTVPTANVDIVGVGFGVAALFWFSGAVLSFGMLIRRARQQAAILGRSKPLDDDSTERTVASIAARLGLRRPPLVRMTAESESPFVTGITRPTLLLPTALWDHLSEAEKEIAICHECVHLQRRDLFTRWIPILAERLFFFLPLARLAAREYLLCNEATCDARVLEVLPATPREYGNVLLAFGTSNHAAVLAVGSSSFAILKRRIAMLAVPPSTSSVASRVVAVALVAAAIVVLTPVRPVARSTASSAPRPTVATAVTATTQFVDAPRAGADGASAGRVSFPATHAATPVTSQNASATTPAPQQRAEAQGMERVSLVAGQTTDPSRDLSIDFDITRLDVTDPMVAEAVVAQPGKVRVVGRGAGTASLTIWGATQRKQYEIVVEPATTPTANDALMTAHKAVYEATAKVRAAKTPDEQERAKQELAEAEARVRPAQDRYRALAYPGMTHEELVARETGLARAMTMRNDAPVIDAGAPTVTVLDFDKTVTSGKRMHFRVSVTGAVPVPTLMVALRPPLGFVRTSTSGAPSVSVPSGVAVTASPTYGMGSSSKVADARTLSDFTIQVGDLVTGDYDITVVATDAQGRTSQWVVGTVTVQPDPDAPTVTVLDFDKTVRAGEPMHFRVIVTGAVPVLTLTVGLTTPPGGVTTSPTSFLSASPTSGLNSPSKVADARTLTDFTINLPKDMTGTRRILLVATDSQGRKCSWAGGTVVVQPAGQ